MSDSRLIGTKCAYYHVGDDVPILTQLPISPDQVTLSDFKTAISLASSPKYKFYFKTIDEEIGIVKVEINDDEARLPFFNGKIICYIEPKLSDEADCSNHSHHDHHHHSHHHSHHGPPSHYYSRCDDYSDTSSRISASTDETSVSRYNLRRADRVMSNASSVSSVTESSAIDPAIRRVVFHLDKTSFLGMSLVGQSSDKCGGIYVGSIMKGGAVAKDGTIQTGDMILQVNEHMFQNMSDDEAVGILRDAAQRGGKIEITVAKFFDAGTETYFTVPHEDPIQPLNLEAWIHTTEAATGLNVEEHFEGTPSSESASTSASHSTMPSSYARSERQLIPDAPELSLATSTMFIIAKYAANSDSGLVIKDRKWLKLIIQNAFLGSDLVNWLYAKVKGFNKRKDALNFAKKMLKENYIKQPMMKKKFSEFCYYTFDESVYSRYPFN